MWFTILPPAMIIYACLAIPDPLGYWAYYFYMGTPRRRSYLTHLHMVDVLRDRRLTGDEHVFLGLENLPDEDEVPRS